MEITKTSQSSGNISSMEIDVTEDQLRAWSIGGKMMQEAMPNISADEREFIKTGITPTEWDELFFNMD
mgnify:FL=1|jgi:hypothetical protein|tara:strand:+ start:314 stop:517 length:204 start_codon:yes stop_codon:yes gene_type:complete